MMKNEETLTQTQLIYSLILKYLRILGSLGFICVALSLYQLRKIKILRQMGSLAEGDQYKVIY
jgi:hypothetical protein